MEHSKPSRSWGLAVLEGVLTLVVGSFLGCWTGGLVATAGWLGAWVLAVLAAPTGRLAHVGSVGALLASLVLSALAGAPAGVLGAALRRTRPGVVAGLLVHGLVFGWFATGSALAPGETRWVVALGLVAGAAAGGLTAAVGAIAIPTR